MACFSNKTKMGCARFVGIVSCLLIIIGLAAGIFGYLNSDAPPMKMGDETYPSPAALFGILAIIGGIFSALTGLLGLATA